MSAITNPFQGYLSAISPLSSSPAPLSPGEGGDALGAAAVTPSVVTDALRAALGVKKIGRVSLCKNGCAVVDVSAAHAQLVRFVVGCMGVRRGVESNLWEVC